MTDTITIPSDFSSISVVGRNLANIGEWNFGDARSADMLLVDKSLFIKDFIYGSKCQLILRPRRFGTLLLCSIMVTACVGKSLNLTMLESFFQLNAKPE